MPLLKTVVAVLLLAVAALFLSFPQHVREYRLYFTESRPQTVLSYEEMSQDWTEADVKARLASVVFRCYDNAPGEYLAERSCFGDVSSHNGVAALTLAFYFAGGRLEHMAVQVPWWKHGALSKSMHAAYGRPSGAQSDFHAGVRLVGWKLRSGNAMFVNLDQPLNPLAWSAVLWSSERACRKGGCFLSAGG